MFSLPISRKIKRAQQELYGLSPEDLLKECAVSKYRLLVDMKCGAGFFTILLGSMLQGDGQVYAFDSDKDKLTQLRTKMNRTNIVPVLLSDINVLPLKDRFVDCVFMGFAFSDGSVSVDLLREVRRIMCGNGRVCIVDWRDSAPQYKGKAEVGEARVLEWLSANQFQVCVHRALNPQQYLILADAMF